MKTKRIIYQTLSSLVAALFLSNCGGAPSASSIPVQTTKPGQSGTLTVSIYIPKLANTVGKYRKPAYVTAAVRSISFVQTLSGGAALATPTTTTIAVGGASCSPLTDGQTCTATLAAPLGQDEWAVETFASEDGSGTPLSRAALLFTIIAGAANTTSLTLNAVVNSLALVPIAGSCNASAACTNVLVLNPIDVTGATIIGPGSFVDVAGKPLSIAIATSDASLSAKTSTNAAVNASVTSSLSNDLAKIVYDGTGVGGMETLTAKAGLLVASYTLTLATGSITSAPGGVLAIGSDGSTLATLPASEPDFAGTFTATPGADCMGVVTVGSVSNGGTPASFAVSQVGAGTCSILIGDGHGGTTSVSVTSTTFSVSVN